MEQYLFLFFLFFFFHFNPPALPPPVLVDQNRRSRPASYWLAFLP
jgi:hypothetical protein